MVEPDGKGKKRAMCFESHYDSDKDDQGSIDFAVSNSGSAGDDDKKPKKRQQHHAEEGEEKEANEEEQAIGDEDDKLELTKKKGKKIHKLSLTETEDFNRKLRKRGVVYLARIPPRMTPTKAKSLLGGFGEVTRVYLAEEDAAARKRRRKMSASKSAGGKRYVEGWVEFASKKIAKHVAASLNNTPITNYKRSPHYGDLWSLKYLHRFQWSHLTEKVAYERRVREQKLRLETMQARRDTATYTQLVETGKKLDKIQERKNRRTARNREGGCST